MPDRARLARRRFLGALAAAPAALAGCAGGAAPGRAGAEARAGGSAPGGPPPDAAAAAVRGLALSPEAEPAFVFRAGAAGSGER